MFWRGRAVKVDLKLLVPDWVLQYKEWNEFLEVLEEAVNEVVGEIEDLRQLYSLDKAAEFIEALANNFGFGLIGCVGFIENLQLLDFQRGFVEKKGSRNFFEKLWELFQVVGLIRDLSQNIMVLSGGRELSGSMLQDGKYYRDGSVEITCSPSHFWLVKELERFVHVGVMVWYNIIIGLQMLAREIEVDDFGIGEGMALGFGREAVPDVCWQTGMAYGMQRETTMQEKVSSYYIVINGERVVLM